MGFCFEAKLPLAAECVVSEEMGSQTQAGVILLAACNTLGME